MARSKRLETVKTYQTYTVIGFVANLGRGMLLQAKWSSDIWIDPPGPLPYTHR